MSTPSIHHRTMPSPDVAVVEYFMYHSMRCHTPSVILGVPTLGYSVWPLPIGASWTEPSILKYDRLLLADHTKASLLTPEGWLCHGLDGIHQKPQYKLRVTANVFSTVAGAPPPAKPMGYQN